MNEELNNADDGIVFDQSESINAGSAPASEPDRKEDNPNGSEVVDGEAKQESKEESEHFINQEAVQKRIGQKTAENHELREKLRLAEQQAKESRDKIAKLEESLQAPIEPPSVDLSYEDPEEYKKQMAAYVRNMAKQDINATKLAELQEQQDRAEGERIKSNITRLEQTSKALGIDFEKVDQAATVLVSANINDMLKDMLLEHEASPALMIHLAKDAELFGELNSMKNPLVLARKVDSLVDQATMQKISKTPAPVQKVKGSSAVEPDAFDKLGATIE